MHHALRITGYYEYQPPAVVPSADGSLPTPQPMVQIVQPVWLFYGHSSDDATAFVAYVQAVVQEHISR